MTRSTAAPADLGERFARGDVEALREAYERFAGPMLATAMRLLGDRDLAAEAVQDAFWRAWRSYSSLDPSREMKPWLYAITRRAAVDVHRRHRRHRATVGLDGTPEAAAGVVTVPFERAWEAWEVREAVERLPSDERDVVRLSHLEGRTHREIASRLGVPLGTVKSRSDRAHRRLRASLRHLLED